MNTELTMRAELDGQSQAPAKKNGRIPVKCRQRNRFIPGFLIGAAALSALSLFYLGIDWGKMLSRAPEIGEVFWQLAHLGFANMDLILSSLVETVSIAVLSLLYSLLLGILFGMLAARNVFRIPALSALTQSFFTFLRAVPTPVWVLLMLVCLGMGPEAGVAGLCVHTTAFSPNPSPRVSRASPKRPSRPWRSRGRGGCPSSATRFCRRPCPRSWPGPGCGWRPISPSAPYWAWWALAAWAMSSPTASRAMTTALPVRPSCWYFWWPTASSASS